MCEIKTAARVMYCGHDWWFAADIVKIGTANVVVANGSVTPENLVRNHNDQATHIVVDFPKSYWAPRKGIFVVPEDQCREL